MPTTGMVREYSGQDTTTIALGRTLAVVSVKYSGKQDKKNKFVMGSDRAYSRTRGIKEYEGEMVIPQSEFETIERTLPAGKTPLDIAPFDITLLYIDSETGIAVTDVLKNCEFTAWDKEMKTGSDGMDISLPLIIGDVLLNFK
jgi:hypothetical protein